MTAPVNPEEPVYTLSIPEHAETREQALAMITDLPEDLSNSHVVIDTSKNPWAKPAFVYEARTQILEVRSAKSLTIKNEGRNDIKLSAQNTEYLTEAWRKAQESHTPASAMKLNDFIRENSYVRLASGNHYSSENISSSH
jgi:hypothetical protein